MSLLQAMKNKSMKDLQDLFEPSVDVIPVNSVEDFHFDSTFVARQGVRKLAFLKEKGTVKHDYDFL